MWGVNRGMKFQKLVLISSFIFALGASPAQADYKTLGLLGGFSFPRFVVGKVDLSLSEKIGLDYQGSLGIYWTIQQGDFLYYIWRDEWSLFTGVGYQFWNFYGFSSATNSNGVGVTGSSAGALSLPLGLAFVDADTGLGFQIVAGLDYFMNGPSDLNGRVLLEAMALAGIYF